MTTTRLYCITNSCNGKMYVGVTCGTLVKRWWTHQRDSAKGSPLPLHRAIRKYGASVFSVEELFEYPTRNEALDAERYLIAVLDLRSSVGYNASEGGDGGNTMQGRTHTAETKALMSAGAKARGQRPPPMTQEQREALISLNRNKKLPEEHKAKLAAGRDANQHKARAAARARSAEYRAAKAAVLAKPPSPEHDRELAELVTRYGYRARPCSDTTKARISAAYHRRTSAFVIASLPTWSATPDGIISLT